MKQLILLICFALVLAFSIDKSVAQTKKSVTGRYYLDSLLEVSSMLYLKRDSTFEFTYASGNIQRKAFGSWKMMRDNIVLTSRPRPPLDYSFTTQRIAHEYTSFLIAVSNHQLLPFYDVSIFTGSRVVHYKPDSNGLIRIPKTKVDKVEILYAQYPERQTIYKITTDHNFFEIRPQPWASEIFFQSISLKSTPGQLSGAHPLLPGTTFNYTRRKQ